jgi:hypothetical protein
MAPTSVRSIIRRNFQIASSH